MNTIRLMIVDDREEICREMSTAIELAAASVSTDIKVVSTANDGLEAIEKADTCNPDLILMDLEMPILEGLNSLAADQGNASRHYHPGLYHS